MAGKRVEQRDDGVAALGPEALAGAPVTVHALLFSAALLGVYLLIPHDAAPGSTAMRLEVVLFTIPQLLAVAGTLIVVRHTRRDERTFWGFLAAVNVFVFIYETPWSLAMWQGRMPPPNETLGSTALLLVPATLFAGLLLSIERRADHPGVARLRSMVDGLVMLVVALVVYQTFLTAPYFSSFGVVDPLVQMRASLHAIVGVGVLAGVAGHLPGLRISSVRSWERLLVGGIAVYALGLVVMPVYHVGIRYAPHAGTQLIEGLLISGHLLMFSAALDRLRASGSQPLLTRHVPGAVADATGSAVRQVIVLAAIAVLVVAAVAARPSSAERTLYLVAGLALCVLLAVRAVVTAVDSRIALTRSITDPVSGARTYPFFAERLRDEVELCARCAEPLAVAMVDLDGFTAHAALQGEDGAQRLLRDAVGAMTPLVGAADTLARLDDDTFAIMLVGATHAWAAEVCEGVRRSVKESTGLTMSVGLALFPEHGLAASELHDRAARALEWARAHGSDRIATFDPVAMAQASADAPPAHRSRSLHAASVQALAAAVDARDADTRHHSRSVADLAALFARHLGFDAERVRRIESAALVHDVGKIAVADRVLRKRGPLNRHERAEIEAHPVLGERIVAASGSNEAATWIRFHHERWDGTGYPEGRMYDEIPLEARLIALCDAYDAMTSPRSYRSRLSPDAALQEIDLGMGTQFDPVLAEEFIPLVRDHIDPRPRL